MAQPAREIAGVFSDITTRNVRRKHLPRLARHLFLDALEALDQPADVVIAIPVVPDVSDDLDNRARLALWRFGGDRRCVPEVLQQCSAEAVEHHEVGLVWEVFALASATAKHLFEQNAGLHWAQKDDTFQIRYIHARGQQINRHDDSWRWAIAELADMLKGTIHPTRDFLSERIASTEDVTSKVYKLVGVRRMRKVVAGKNERLRQATISLFVLQHPLLDLFENLPI